MSNLVKSSNIIVSDGNKLIIDSNKIIDDMLSQRVNYGVKAPEADPDGFVCGLDAATVEALTAESVSEEDIITAANERAEEIVATANERAELIMTEAQKKGYDEGLNRGLSEAEARCYARLNELENEYANRKEQLEREYESLKASMEPELVNALLEVFSSVTGVLGEARKDTILHLINSVMHNTELSREFMIKVSEEDYQFVINNKDMIYGAASPEYHIDIVRDSSLQRNMCVIETDAGVFDCSLDIQLDNLIQEIKILSCLH